MNGESAVRATRETEFARKLLEIKDKLDAMVGEAGRVFSLTGMTLVARRGQRFACSGEHAAVVQNDFRSDDEYLDACLSVLRGGLRGCECSECFP